MRRERVGRLCWLATLLLASVAACGDNIRLRNRPDDVLWSSEHFDYYTRAAEASACEGVVNTLERHHSAVIGYLGLRPSSERITYRKYVDAADLKVTGACPTDASACEHAKIIETSEVLQRHELVHAYLEEWGSPPPLFSEGVAEALSCPDAVPWKPSGVGWRELRPGTALDLYGPGKWFVGYLLHTFGPEPFLRLYQGSWYLASNEEIQARVAEVYGRTLDELWAEALTADPARICVRVWECAARSLNLAGEELDFRDGCDGTGKYATISVDAAALLDARGGGNLVVRRCGVGGGGPTIDPPSYANHIVAELEPGTVYLTSEQQGSTWRATLGPPLPSGAACAPIPFGPATEQLSSWTFAARARTEPLLLALPAPVTAEFLRLGDPSNLGAPASAETDLCDDCSAADCTPLSSARVQRAVGAFRIRSVAPEPDGFVYARVGASSNSVP
jgi:hypothetical protein